MSGPGAGSFALSFAAGALTTLAPCVLPVLPFVVAGSLREGRKGPLALAAGLTLSFVVIGWTLSAFGPAIGLQREQLRVFAAVLLVLMGLLITSARLQNVFGNWTAPIANAAERFLQKRQLSGTRGNFLTGSLLGLVWTPCSGPTLGSAIALASTEGGRLTSAGMMLLFGIGASTPLLLIAYGARGFFERRKSQALQTTGAVKTLFGVLCLVLGFGVLTGADRWLEGAITDRLPDRWIDLTTRF